MMTMKGYIFVGLAGQAMASVPSNDVRHDITMNGLNEYPSCILQLFFLTESTTMFFFSSRLSVQARDLIIGGFGVSPEYYRFFARLQSAEGTCGGSMIAPDMLLTAGHWYVLYLYHCSFVCMYPCIHICFAFYPPLHYIGTQSKW